MNKTIEALCHVTAVRLDCFDIILDIPCISLARDADSLS